MARRLLAAACLLALASPGFPAPAGATDESSRLAGKSVLAGTMLAGQQQTAEPAEPPPEPNAGATFGWPGSVGLDPQAGQFDLPLGERIGQVGWVADWLPFHHADPDHPARHNGWGLPLQGTSWLNRPWHAGWFVGQLYGDDLVNGQVRQDDDLFGGYRLGYDFDHYWGAEARVGFARLGTLDNRIPARSGISRHWFWDAQLMYYPWGDAQWRPYFSLGMGLAHLRFVDHLPQGRSEVLFHLPLGMGVKYLVDRWLALRLDLMDNIALGQSRVGTMHNLSLTLGVEVHFGGRPTSYFPWHDGIHFW